MKILIDETSYTVAKYSPKAQTPDLASCRGFKSVTYTDEECSVIAATADLDLTEALESESEWFILKIDGILDFSLTGILAKLALPLAENKISIFAMSTYNTDYILLKEADKILAIQVLEAEGHELVKR
ncbi:ACT domain-containing protein [Carnobacterium gallinarum]|uniref:ACT domain-containing protein n=1 Tax=Carnobacterium gallinarum TaxID=2749 RepID=UPI0005559E54|nr:ACT domain-containing protein [Carnobacterium gallinarum]